VSFDFGKKMSTSSVPARIILTEDELNAQPNLGPLIKKLTNGECEPGRNGIMKKIITHQYHIIAEKKLKLEKVRYCSAQTGRLQFRQCETSPMSMAMIQQLLPRVVACVFGVH
jgi:hypothetical protein